MDINYFRCCVFVLLFTFGVCNRFLHMVYIVVLNWKGFYDTVWCLTSLFKLQDVNFRIIICDNFSPDNSYSNIRNWILDNQKGNCFLTQKKLIELDRGSAEKYIINNNEDALYLIQTGANLGFAGGNNVAIRFAMNQPDMHYVWVLNNDTEVEPDSLYHMVKRCESDPQIGICGSRLVYYHDKRILQGLGGIINPWLCTTKHYAAFEKSDLVFKDDEIEKNIDYIIGASMLLSRRLLEKIGLLCEDYFLYYEEVDIAQRAKPYFRIGVASNSVVYHKEGASTGGNKNFISDSCYLKNRLLIAKRFFPRNYWLVRLSYIVPMFNRIRRLQYLSFKLCVRLFVCGG